MSERWDQKFGSLLTRWLLRIDSTYDVSMRVTAHNRNEISNHCQDAANVGDLVHVVLHSCGSTTRRPPYAASWARTVRWQQREITTDTERKRRRQRRGKRRRQRRIKKWKKGKHGKERGKGSWETGKRWWI